MVELAYGQSRLTIDEPYFRILEEVLHILHEGSRPSLLDLSPICKSKIRFFTDRSDRQMYYS